MRISNGSLELFTKKKKSLKDPFTFKFLNKTERLMEIGWDGIKCQKLWRYNQHYFDDLNAKGSSERKKWHHNLIIDWLKSNKPGLGTGWEPYPTSLRIVNWIKWDIKGNNLSDDALQSLAIQTRWLNKKIEWHILGNHLFANAKALIFAGFFFDGKEAKEWLDKGWNIAISEISEQILKDGGHFELSTMYHSIFLEDILDLINILRLYSNLVDKTYNEQCLKTAIKMLNWLQTMQHPDGEISFFNDSAIGIASSPNEIISYANRLGIISTDKEKFSKGLSYKHFNESGYIVIETENSSLFLDVAHIGAKYLPGHGHADILSFEMSIFGKRVFVNGGTSEYETSKIRLQERSTAAHNTVVINNQNSSEVWSSFRVAKRAKPFDLNIKKNNDNLFVSCAHDGYKKLKGRPIHRRFWEVYENKLLITDKIEGSFCSARSLFHFHPDIKIIQSDEYKWTLSHPSSKNNIIMTVLNGLSSLESSFYSPEFGVRLPTNCLSVEFTSSKIIVIQISWSQYE